jgi:hypothetical protein
VGPPSSTANLIADPTGVTIIDAGLPGYWKQLPGELEAMGRSDR